MVLFSNRILRGARLLAVALSAVGAVVSVCCAAPAAHADAVPVSALVLRNETTTIFRQPSSTTTLTAARGTANGSPVIVFNSQVGSDLSTFESVTVTAGLTPGTYSTSRIPGDSQATLDPGSILQCGGDEPGTLAVDQADYDGAGNPVDFAASFDVASCDSRPAVHGEIRWNSTVPFELAQAPAMTSVGSPVTVNSSAEVTVRFTSVGTRATSMGAATLSQTPMSDGHLDWSIVNDGCSGRTLVPGDNCAVTARIAPIRPDGVPHGTVYAQVRVPDGTAVAASAQIAADVYPLAGQALALQARGMFRQVVLSWAAPQLAPAGWSVFHQLYYVYEYLHDGGLHLLTTTSGHTAVITGLPDLYTARYVVRDEQSGANAPLSVPASAATASSELLYIATPGGLRARPLAPTPAASASAAITSLHNLGETAASSGLTVARNQAVLAYTTFGASQTPPTTAYVCAAATNASPGAEFCSGTNTSTQWDTAPALSPDGKRVVFTRADGPGASTTLEISSTATNAKATPVPNSAGLSDATFNAAGTGLVAVAAVGDTTELVTLSLTGTRTVLPGSEGLSDPDVAPDGRIVAVESTPEPGAAPTTSLVLLSPGASTPVAIPGAQNGTNVRPRFAANGAIVFYTHDDAAQASTTGYGDTLETGEPDEIDLASGAITELADTSSAGTPYVLTANGTHHVDTAAPTVRMVAPSPTVDLASTAIVSWTGTDPQVTNQVASGVRNYDVRYRTASVGHSFGGYGYPSPWHATQNRSVTMHVSAGHEYCFSARARDFTGNVSAWTPDRCTVSPVDDHTMHTTASRRTSGKYYLHTYSYAAKKGVRLTLTGVTSRRVIILATTCASCGRIQVSVGSHVLGRINTHTASTHYRQTLWLPTTPTHSGTLRITTLSKKPVRIDGVAIEH